MENHFNILESGSERDYDLSVLNEQVIVNELNQVENEDAVLANFPLSERIPGLARFIAKTYYNKGDDPQVDEVIKRVSYHWQTGTAAILSDLKIFTKYMEEGEETGRIEIDNSNIVIFKDNKEFGRLKLRYAYDMSTAPQEIKHRLRVVEDTYSRPSGEIVEALILSVNDNEVAIRYTTSDNSSHTTKLSLDAVKEIV